MGDRRKRGSAQKVAGMRDARTCTRLMPSSCGREAIRRIHAAACDGDR